MPCAAANVLSLWIQVAGNASAELPAGGAGNLCRLRRRCSLPAALGPLLWKAAPPDAGSPVHTPVLGLRGLIALCSRCGMACCHDWDCALQAACRLHAGRHRQSGGIRQGATSVEMGQGGRRCREASTTARARPPAPWRHTWGEAGLRGRLLGHGRGRAAGPGVRPQPRGTCRWHESPTVAPAHTRTEPRNHATSPWLVRVSESVKATVGS